MKKLFLIKLLLLSLLKEVYKIYLENSKRTIIIRILLKDNIIIITRLYFKDILYIIIKSLIIFITRRQISKRS